MKFTRKQGLYLAFIYNYTKIAGGPPAEADMQHHFRVRPSSGGVTGSGLDMRQSD